MYIVNYIYAYTKTLLAQLRWDTQDGRPRFLDILISGLQLKPYIMSYKIYGNGVSDRLIGHVTYWRRLWSLSYILEFRFT